MRCSFSKSSHKFNSLLRSRVWRDCSLSFVFLREGSDLDRITKQRASAKKNSRNGQIGAFKLDRHKVGARRVCVQMLLHKGTGLANSLERF